MTAQSAPKPTLRQRVLLSGTWTLLGYGINQIVRLGGNLILTRLLFPEAFGVMAIIQSITYGAAMITDVGIGASIVRKEKENDAAFLNTAWTVQIVRGFAMWILFCLLAWPISTLYGEPLFILMLPLAGLDAIIGGFRSTKYHTAERNMDAARITQIEVASNVLGLLFTALLAWSLQSVWALLLGGMISTAMRTIASHIFLHGIKNKFAWDRHTLDHLRGFGRWIMFGSTLTFLSAEGSRLFLGAMLDMHQLALFTLASTMSLVIWQAMQQLAARIFFPAYTELFRLNPEKLLTVLKKTRLFIIIPSWGSAVLFIFFGSQLMNFLYDARYTQSGEMLIIIATGSLISCVWGSYSGVLLTLGKVATISALTAIQIALQFTLMYIGYQYGQATGLILGLAATNWILYPFYAYALWKNGVWQPKLDFIILLTSVTILILTWSRIT